MRPVMQTRFYDPTLPVGEQRGNCLQAVLASLLELDLADVPHFVQDHVDNDGDSNWEWGWHHRMTTWLHGQGLALFGVPVDQPGEYLAVTGRSPRGQGIHHIVIYRDGELAHDPHPDGTGVLDVTDVFTIRDLEKGAAA